MSDLIISSFNRLITALTTTEYDRLAPYLQLVSLPLGKILYEPNQLIQEVYFPNQAMISVVSMVNSHAKGAITLIGNEGMVGLPVVLGGNTMPFLVVVEIADSAFKLDAELLKQEFQRAGEIQKILLLYTQAHLTEISQAVACKNSHRLEQRLAGSLLSVRNCIQKDNLNLTQQLLSRFLGVRRASITEAAIALQKEGIIRYSRGEINILDGEALQSKACGCYLLIREEFNRLLKIKS